MLHIRRLENGLERPGGPSHPKAIRLGSLVGLDAFTGVLQRGILESISATTQTKYTRQCQGGVWLPFLDTYRTMSLVPTPEFRVVLEEIREMRRAA
jgi:hypothetical protein